MSGVRQTERALRPSLRWRLAEAWSIQAELRVSDVQSDEPVGSRRPFFYPSPGTNVETTNRLSWEPSRYLIQKPLHRPDRLTGLRPGWA